MQGQRYSRLLLLGVLAGCLISGGCSEDNPAPSAPPCLGFTADGGMGDVLSQNGVDSTCDVALVEVMAFDQTDVFALDVEILYPSSIAFLSGVDTSDSFLRSDGTDVVTIVGEPEAGRIVLGISRVSASGIDIVGGQLVATLVFINRGTTGTGDLELSDECLLGSENPPQPKVGLVCIGGTIRAQ